MGFSTHHGWVTAAWGWDEPAQRKCVSDGIPGSWEKVFHQTGQKRFWLDLRDDLALRPLVSEERLQRAIGVIYRPETTRQTHYFFSHSARQFDALIHIDEASALEPLDKGSVWFTVKASETFKTGI